MTGIEKTHKSAQMPSAALQKLMAHKRMDPDEAALLLRKPARPVFRPRARLAPAVRAIMRPLAKKHRASYAEISLRWPELAGARLARVSRPLKLTGHAGGAILHIEARGGPGAALIELEADNLVARINDAFGAGTLSAIRLVQGRIKRPVAARPPKRTMRALTPNEVAALDARLDGLPKGPLRDAVRALGMAVLSRERERG